MNLQQTQNCHGPGIMCLLTGLLETLFAFLSRIIDGIRRSNECREARHRYLRLDQTTLRDIGMNDPQTQLSVLGRYL